MANAVENALSRINAEQRAKAEQVMAEARRNIRLVSLRDDLSPSDADSLASNARIIDEAKRTIPFDTMRDVDTISAPLPTPNNRANYSSKVVCLNPETYDRIELIEQNGGNNYLNENAIDRALTRQSQEVSQPEQHRDQQQYAQGR